MAAGRPGSKPQCRDDPSPSFAAAHQGSCPHEFLRVLSKTWRRSGSQNAHIPAGPAAPPIQKSFAIGSTLVKEAILFPFQGMRPLAKPRKAHNHPQQLRWSVSPPSSLASAAASSLASAAASSLASSANLPRLIPFTGIVTFQTCSSAEPKQ